MTLVIFSRRRTFHSVRLLTAMATVLVSGATLINAATFGTSSYLHVNLSFMPFTYYDYNHSAASYGFTQSVNNTPIPSCPPGASVRSCFQTILGQLAAQRVEGVRIFVTFCDPSSLAFVQTNGTTECGLPYSQVSWNPSGNSIQNTWITNVGNFFADLNVAKIQNIHITTGASSGNTFSLPIGSTSSPIGSCSISGKCCSDTGSTVYFNPLVPFGMASNGFPIGDYYNTANNQGYNCAPINSQYFVGWTNYLNVINAILAKAYNGGQVLVNVFGLEIQQEVQTQIFTALLRYFYDNALPQSAPSQYVQTVQGQQIANILAALRAQMSANHFDPGRVVYSGAWTDASTATANCTDVYTDYARNWSQDTVTQAINGGYIGVAQGWTAMNGLTCNGTTTNMFTSPIYSTQPDLVDIHIYPSVTGTQNTDAMVQQVAALDYGDVPHFITLSGLQSATFVIGETYGGKINVFNQGTTQNPNYCFGGQYSAPSGAPNDNVAGFNSSSLSSYTVIVRPWMELEDPTGVCFPYGTGPGSSGNYQTVNYNGQGPYIPTH